MAVLWRLSPLSRLSPMVHAVGKRVVRNSWLLISLVVTVNFNTVCCCKLLSFHLYHVILLCWQLPHPGLNQLLLSCPKPTVKHPAHHSRNFPLTPKLPEKSSISLSPKQWEVTLTLFPQSYLLWFHTINITVSELYCVIRTTTHDRLDKMLPMAVYSPPVTYRIFVCFHTDWHVVFLKSRRYRSMCNLQNQKREATPTDDCQREYSVIAHFVC